jgi:hypothetical protein
MLRASQVCQGAPKLDAPQLILKAVCLHFGRTGRLASPRIDHTDSPSSICAMSIEGLMPSTRAISMNSSTSIRRSPASSFQTNESDLFNLSANCRWFRRAAFRAATITEISTRCFALRRCVKVPPNWLHHS